MKTRKGCDRTLKHAIIKGFKSWTITFYIMLRRLKVTERKIDILWDKFWNQSFVIDSVKNFRFLQRSCQKRSTKSPNAENEEKSEREKRISTITLFTEITFDFRNRVKIWRISTFYNLQTLTTFYGGEGEGGTEVITKGW